MQVLGFSTTQTFRESKITQNITSEQVQFFQLTPS